MKLRYLLVILLFESYFKLNCIMKILILNSFERMSTEEIGYT